MRLDGLRITALRNLSEIDLAPTRTLNVIAGPNASGKTALLEAIYLLGRGRSFRTPRISELIQYGQTRFIVTASLNQGSHRTIPLGVERDHKRTHLRYDSRSIQSLSEHARRVPLILITPENHRLVSDRPGHRRRWLDWALFHVEPTYLIDWRDCFYALRQRNALLKRTATSAQFHVWEQAFARSADSLDAMRRDLIKALNERLRDVLNGLLTGIPRIDYRPGWPNEVPLLDLLRQQRRHEQIRGFTCYGPHRSDLEFLYDGYEVRAHLSRGQTKLYIAAFMLAYAELLKEAGLCPILLIDDLPAELDQAARQRLMTLLLATGAQIFVTAIEPGLVDALAQDAAVFHVEQGRLKEVIQ